MFLICVSVCMCAYTQKSGTWIVRNLAQILKKKIAEDLYFKEGSVFKVFLQVLFYYYCLFFFSSSWDRKDHIIRKESISCIRQSSYDTPNALGDYPYTDV